jgi:hypothetical protein
MSPNRIRFAEYVPVAPVRLVRAYHCYLPNLWGEASTRKLAGASLAARLAASLPGVESHQAVMLQEALDDARAYLAQSRSRPGASPRRASRCVYRP